MRSAENHGKESGVQDAEKPSWAKKRPYVAPRLKRQAHLRDITLGVSPGEFDSNDPDNLKADFVGARAKDGSIEKRSGIFENDIFGG